MTPLIRGGTGKNFQDKIGIYSDCNPSTWEGYDGVTCGDCVALVEIEDQGSCGK